MLELCTHYMCIGVGYQGQSERLHRSAAHGKNEAGRVRPS